MKQTNSQDISFDIKEWTEKGFGIEWLQMKEVLGGDLPTGTASLIFPQDESVMEWITEQNTGTIIIDDNNNGGFCFEVPMFITSREYDGNNLSIGFVCCPDPEFFSTRISRTYEDINDALNFLYPNIDRRTESDQNNNQPIHQLCETSLNFCKRLCYSYKHGAIFGFGWDGLVIKDIIGLNYRRADENLEENIPEVCGGGTGDLTNIEPYNLTYSRQQNYPIINPWTDSSYTLPKNVTSVLGADYLICRSGYDNMIDNFLYNTTLFNTDYKANYTLSGIIMPNNFRLGDVVKFKRADDHEKKDMADYTKCLVYSNEVFFSNGNCGVVGRSTGKPFEWHTELRGITDGGWTQTQKEQEILWDGKHNIS